MIEILDVKNASHLLGADLKAIMHVNERLLKSDIYGPTLHKVSFDTMETKNGLYKWHFKLDVHDDTGETFHINLWAEEYETPKCRINYPIRITESEVFLLKQGYEWKEYTYEKTSVKIK